MAKRFVFRHFRTRLVAFIVVLVLVLQALVFFTVGTAANRSAIGASEEALQLTLLSLQETMSTRENNLRKFARLLSHDFAFKALVSVGDPATLMSAFRSYRKRLGADWMFVLDLEGGALADTLDPAGKRAPSALRALSDSAANDPQEVASSIEIIDGRAYQVVLVPVKGPLTIAWVGIGFEVTDLLAKQLERQTHTSVSLVWRTPAGQPMLLASTLDQQQRRDYLANHQGAMLPAAGGAAARITAMAGEEYVAIEAPLRKTGGGVLLGALQRSLDEALGDYHVLRWQLLAVFVLSTLMAAFAAIYIASRVTRPVRRLAAGAKRISAGHYETIGDIGAHDELGTLAASFDDMVHGLIERDKVRDMLGKVVSPAIAEELLSQNIDFSGQEQEVSVMFSDIRGFTTLCEGRAPSEILSMLNTYLGTVSDLIDGHDGVVDKYIGDAVMALYGAPLVAPDDPQRALETALAMVGALPALNAQFARDGWPPLAIGIGIHSGIVVAGNIGSRSRLNYTVLGDTVNLASRLEGLCKHYGEAIIVSEATMRRCPGIAFRELDLVRVKGKQEAVAIFSVIGHRSDISARRSGELALHAQALADYRGGRFEQALTRFEAAPRDGLTKLYMARCARHIAEPPARDWDAVESLTEK
ncbi:adenylate/guanylate cyclase domain-containing protein [Massilia glaciei]|nr:adenylate/guanylate cyclase domain-containing protein [Massilia glaciei]